MRCSFSAKSAASTPPASARMLTSASRASYSPESSVRTSISSSALRTDGRARTRPRRGCPASSSSSASSKSTLEVVDPAAQRLGLAELGLEVRQLAGDLLRRLRVVPQGRRRRLLLEHGDVCPQLVEVQDGLDRPHGRGEGLQLFGYIDDCHGSSVTAAARTTPAAGPAVRTRRAVGQPGAAPGASDWPVRLRTGSAAGARRPGRGARPRRRRSWPASRRRPPPRDQQRAPPTPSVMRRLRTGGRLVAGRARARRWPGARGARAVPRAPPASSSGAGTRIAVWVSRLESGRRAGHQRDRAAAARRPPGPAGARGVLVRLLASPARRPARRRPAAASRPAAAAAPAAGPPARRRAAGRPGPWPGTARAAATARRGCRAAGRRSR